MHPDINIQHTTMHRRELPSMPVYVEPELSYLRRGLSAILAARDLLGGPSRGDDEITTNNFPDVRMGFHHC